MKISDIDVHTSYNQEVRREFYIGLIFVVYRIIFNLNI